MRFVAVLGIALSTVALSASPAAAAIVTGGVVEIGRGAAGVRLGMTRAAVVEKLGEPVYENPRYLQYGPDESATTAFDVYLSETTGSPVRMLGFWGDRFRLADGTRLFRRGAIRKLRERYGSRLKRSYDPFTDIRTYRLRSRYRGRLVWNDFNVDQFGSRARITSVLILYP